MKSGNAENDKTQTQTLLQTSMQVNSESLHVITKTIDSLVI